MNILGLVLLLMIPRLCTPISCRHNFNLPLFPLPPAILNLSPTSNLFPFYFLCHKTFLFSIFCSLAAALFSFSLFSLLCSLIATLFAFSLSPFPFLLPPVYCTFLSTAKPRSLSNYFPNALLHYPMISGAAPLSISSFHPYLSSLSLISLRIVRLKCISLCLP